MKPPKNFYNAVDRRKLDISDNLLPDVTTSDAGKVLKVSEAGAWQLADDENTIIEANSDEQPTVDLENLKIGDTVYLVNKPTFEYIKGIRLTISDGGQYRTDKPKVEFYDDAGNVVTTPTYTSSCDKEYAGNISLNQVCSIATSDAPGVFTYVFDNNMAVTINHLIKLTNAGSFAGDIAKSVKVELSSDGENWLELWFDPSIAWSGSANAYRIIDIKTGEVSNTLLPIVTSSDNGKVLGVVSGVWDKTDIPSLPTVSASDNGKILNVLNGDWKSSTYPLDYGTIMGEINLTNNNITLAAGSSYGVDKIVNVLSKSYPYAARLILTDSSNFKIKYVFYPYKAIETSSSNKDVILYNFELNKKITIHQGAGGNTTATVTT